MPDKVNISREQFKAYLAVQQSGLTNMFDANKVIELAKEFMDVNLSRQQVIQIIGSYDEYVEKWGKDGTA